MVACDSLELTSTAASQCSASFHYRWLHPLFLSSSFCCLSFHPRSAVSRVHGRGDAEVGSSLRRALSPAAVVVVVHAKSDVVDDSLLKPNPQIPVTLLITLARTK